MIKGRANNIMNNPLFQRVGGSVNQQTLAADLVLAVNAATIQRLDPGGANRNVDLPAEASSNGRWFGIVNTADAAENLVVRNDGAATILVLTQGTAAWFACDGSTWFHLGQEAIGPFAALRYSSNFAQSIPSATNTILNYEDRDFGDNAGDVVVGASWAFTVPIGGRYLVTSRMAFAATAWLALQQIHMLILLNGSIESFKRKVFHAGFTGETMIDLSTLMDCRATDTIAASIHQTTAGAIATNTSTPANHISIIRVPGTES